MTSIYFYIVTIIGGVVASLIYYLLKKKRDPLLVAILEHLTRYYLDERFFSIDKVSEQMQIPKEVVEKAIVKLEKSGIVMRTKRGYALVDPLVFLTPRDFERALRLTKGDNIIYGAYQLPYVTDLKYLSIQTLLLIGSFALLIATIFNIGNINATIQSWAKGADPVIFALFVMAISILLVDVIDNLEKIFIREKYSVIVGVHSGLLYDVSIADELSGRVSRGSIVKIDVDINWRQKLKNMFGEVPIGDIKIWVRNKKEPIVLRSLPYPRELFMVLRSLQLGSLEWRKRYARELALWRGRVYPFVPARGRGRRRR